MISVLLNSGQGKELRYMNEYMKYISAKLSEEYWEYHAFADSSQVIDFLLDNPSLDMVCIDITLMEGLDNAKTVRRLSESTLIMLIADASISPMSYIHPDIMAAYLLLRPFDGARLKETLKSMVKLCIKNIGRNSQSGKTFAIDGKDGKRLLSYDRILYFETVEKKLTVVTDSVDYTFYGTLESLEKELPEGFLRCHRSFLVNAERISKIKLSQGVIVLDSGDEIPLSRSYKARFKELEI